MCFTVPMRNKKSRCHHVFVKLWGNLYIESQSNRLPCLGLCFKCCFPCILYEEYNEKRKNKKIGVAELLYSSFMQPNKLDQASIKSKAEHDIGNQVSYKWKDNSNMQNYKELANGKMLSNSSKIFLLSL